MNKAISFGFKDESVANPERTMVIDHVVKRVDERLDLRAAGILAKARAFTILDRDDYSLADKILSEGAAIIKGIKLIHDPICKATNTAHKTAMGARKILIDPVDQACKIISTLMGNFKLDEFHRVAEKQQTLVKKAQKEQEDHAFNQAAEMEKEGAPKELVEAVLKMAEDPVQITQPVDQELRSKNSFTPSWDIEVLDKALVPDYYKTVNEGALRAAVKAAKGNITIPGIRVFDTFKTRRKAL